MKRLRCRNAHTSNKEGLTLSRAGERHDGYRRETTGPAGTKGSC